MAPASLFVIIALLFVPANALLQSSEEGFISVSISERGLEFAKEILIDKAVSALAPLEIPKIEKFVKIPLLGNVHIVLSNITICRVDVSASYANSGETGISIVVSGATANMSMNWCYSYSTWLIPLSISDNGNASIQVDGMEVGLTLGLENHGGTLKLSVIESGCYVKTLSINLDGGASWLYKGVLKAFKGRIKSAVENAITKKLKEAVSKCDYILQTIPKEIPVGGIAAINVTFVNAPLLSNSSVGFEINGLFTSVDKFGLANYYHKTSQTSVSCKGSPRMIGISLDEAVFNSAAAVYFNADFMQWTVDKLPDHLLNTAGWRYVIPELYKKYPNDNMSLNISLSYPPFIRISEHKIDATIYSDITIDVLDASEVIPVACISLVMSGSASAEFSKNILAGTVSLDDFTLSLKWSKIGNLHLFLVQPVMWAILKTVSVPYVNSHLRKGYPLPVIHGFTFQNAEILYINSKIVVCSDVGHADQYNVPQLPIYAE